MSEQNDNLLPGGLRFFNPPLAAPDFVLCSIVVTPNELFEYCKKHPEYMTEYEGKKQLKIQVLVAKSGKVYGKVDDYKKEEVTGRVPKNPNKAAAAAPATEEAPSADDLLF